MTMRLPCFRVRTLMLAVCMMALLVWGGLMGARSYAYSRLATEYGMQERGWRDTASRRSTTDPGMARFGSECAEYYARLTAKYRRAMWRPWRPVAPDPPAPGWVESGAQWVEKDGQTLLVFPPPAGSNPSQSE